MAINSWLREMSKQSKVTYQELRARIPILKWGNSLPLLLVKALKKMNMKIILGSKNSKAYSKMKGGGRELSVSL